jgi:hypothetical protein
MSGKRMRAARIVRSIRAGLACAWIALVQPALAADPLQSWNAGPTKQALLNFVERVTQPQSPQFVRPTERIAAFDNDGTLWCEQPMYVQAQFVVDRVRQLSPQHPEWRTLQPFQGILSGDLGAVAAGGERGIVQLVMATHAGMTTDEFQRTVINWITTARHPRFARPFTMGKLDSALQEAHNKGWTVVDMKTDWNRVFMFQQHASAAAARGRKRNAGIGRRTH